VESIRAARRSAATPVTATLSAADPLNLVGILVPGERVPAISGRYLTIRNGIAVTAESLGHPILAASS